MFNLIIFTFISMCRIFFFFFLNSEESMSTMRRCETITSCACLSTCLLFEGNTARVCWSQRNLYIPYVYMALYVCVWVDGYYVSQTKIQLLGLKCTKKCLTLCEINFQKAKEKQETLSLPKPQH